MKKSKTSASNHEILSEPYNLYLVVFFSIKKLLLRLAHQQEELLECSCNCFSSSVFLGCLD